MRRNCRGDPGLTAVIGKEAIFFLSVFGKITANDDKVLSAVQGIVIFNRDGIGAGGGFALEDGQIDRPVADEEPGIRATADEAGFVPVEVATLVPLEAKQPSPVSALGNSMKGMSCQVSPPSKLRVTKNRPLTGSPTTMPLLIFQNSMASRNMPGVVFSYTNFQVKPPSVVFKMSAGSAMAMMMAVFASKLRCRKSLFS